MLFMKALDKPTCCYGLVLEVGDKNVIEVGVKIVHHATQKQLELRPRIMKMRKGQRKWRQ